MARTMRWREWEIRYRSIEASALVPFLAGQTLLDVGPSNGLHSAYWKKQGFEPTLVDCCMCIADIREFVKDGIRYEHEDFYKFSTKNRFDTVVMLHSLEIMGALPKALEHAKKRVVSTVLTPADEQEWNRKKKKYFSWINEMIGVANANKDKVEIYLIIFGGGMKIVGKLSLEDLKQEWASGSMNYLRKQDYDLVMVVDKKDPDAKILFPSKFIRQSDGVRLGYY